MEAERRFRAMGTDVHLVLVGDEAESLASRAQDRIADLESRWSRFLATSEISRLNANAGYPTVCSPETVALVRRALEAWNMTDGRFDPTVLGAVVRAGYDSSFDVIPDNRAVVSTHDERVTGADGIVVDTATNMVMIPRGVGFDPGGIGKGFAADIVSGEAIAAGAVGVCVNVGGDVRLRGDAPEGGGWRVDVLDPNDLGVVRATVGIGDGAIATSTRARRTWRVGDKEQHHLVDPASGAPIENDVLAVSVIARDCWRAEVLAKAAFVGGVDAGLALFDVQGVAGVIIARDDTLHPSARWADFTIAVTASA
jgi:thiamine biosynthesis lipoprotein